MSPQERWFAMIVAVLSAGGWLLYFRWKDRARPEPWWLMVAAAGGGGVGVLLALSGFAFAASVGVDTRWEDLEAADLHRALLAALRVGVVEESSKLLVVVPIALWAHAFDELFDGIVYAACAALGFATVETVILFGQGDWLFPAALARAVAGGLTHALLAAPWGYGLAVAVLHRRKVPLVVGLAVSIVAHAGYDLMLAQPGFIQSASALVVLVLWIALIAGARRLSALAPVRRA